MDPIENQEYTQSLLLSQIVQALHPQTIANIAKPYSNCYFYSNARTITDVFNNTIYNRPTYTQTTSDYYTLIALYCTAAKIDPIVFNPQHTTISETEYTNKTYYFNAIVYGPQNQQVNKTTPNVINVVHIPKGKTYLKQILAEEYPETQSITHFDKLLIQNVNHYIAMYTNIPTNGMYISNEQRISNAITIITDTVNNQLMEQIYTLIPLLYDKLIDYNNLPEANKKALEEIKKLFKILYAQTFLKYQLHGVYTAPTETNTLNFEENCIITLAKGVDAGTTTLKPIIETTIKYIEELLQLTDINCAPFLEKLKTVKQKRLTGDLESRITQTRRNIDSYERTLTQYYFQLDEAIKQLNVMSGLAEDNVDSFKDALNNRAIEVLKIENDNTELVIRVTALAQHFLSEDFVRYEQNPRSVINTRQYSKAFLNVLHKIFVTREYKLILQAVVRVSLDRYSTNFLSINASNESTLYTECPNPHLYHYNCWSKAKTQMINYAIKNEYDLMFLQMVAAIQSVNIAEVPSFLDGLIVDLASKQHIKSKTHLIDQANKVITLKEAIQYEQTLIDDNTNEQKEDTPCEQLD